MKPSFLHIKSHITRQKLIGSVGILFAVFLAAVLGNYIARIATRQINNALTIYIVGIFIGLLIGMLVGVYFKRGWDKLLLLIKE